MKIKLLYVLSGVEWYYQESWINQGYLHEIAEIYVYKRFAI